MAHFVLEYSSNLDGEALALQPLFAKLHTSAAESGVFPLKGIRSRAYRCEEYRLADGNAHHAFVHLQVLMGAGRDEETRQHVAKAFFAILQQHLSPLFAERGLALSFELKELEPVLKFNKNNIQDYLNTQDSTNIQGSL